MSDITKSETRLVFDRDKIGVGDVVRVPYHTFHPRRLFKTITYPIYGIVKEVCDTELVVLCAIDEHPFNTLVWRVDQSDEIEVLHRFEKKEV
jgi:hypothetical protein